MQALWDWCSDNVWTLTWVGLALVLCTVELTTLDFFFLMLAGGAGSGALIAATGAEFVIQALVASVVSLALLGVVRPMAKRRMFNRDPGIGTSALVGRRGLVLERVDGHHGQIKLAGEVWTARSYDGISIFEPGSHVGVVEIDGATAVVFTPD
jgi:membrane protein implicated in regulation of membrane protease activity